MALMDDWKKKTEEGLKTIKETAGEIAFNVEKQARVAKYRMDILRAQRKIQKVYAEIGEYVHGEFAMERPVTFEAPFVAERLSAITRMKAELRDIEILIEETRKAQPTTKDSGQ